MKYVLLFAFLFSSTICSAQRLIPYHGINGWGFADTTGKVVIAPTGWSYYVDKGVSGLILRDGKAVYDNPPKVEFRTLFDKKAGKQRSFFCSAWNKAKDTIFDWEDNRTFQERSGYFVVGNYSKGHLMKGMIDSTGKVIIPLQYSALVPWPGFIYVDSARLVGAYSYDGAEIIPANYKSILRFYNDRFFVCEKHDQDWIPRNYYGKTDFLDRAGKFVFSIKGEVTDVSHDFIVGDSDSIRFYSGKGKWLFSLDTTGRCLKEITPHYIQLASFKTNLWNYWRDGVADAYELYTHDGKFIRRDSTELQLFLRNGSILIYEKHREMVAANKAHYLLIDRFGNLIDDIEADTIENDWSFNVGPLFFLCNEKIGWLSSYDGHVMVAAKYNMYMPRLTDNPEERVYHSCMINNENFRACTNEGIYLLDTNGVVLSEPFPRLDIVNGLAYGPRNDSLVFMNTHGKEIGKAKGKWIWKESNDDLLIISDENGAGLMRISDFQMMFPCIASYITPADDLYIVEILREINGKPNFNLYWYVDKNGHSYIDPELLKTIPE
jgi:hypothetical protein